MKKHREQIIKALSECSQRARLLFGLLAAERLRACCWVAYSRSNVWSVYASALEHGFAVVCSENAMHAGVIDGLIAELEEIIPDGGDPLYVQGQSATICVLEALRQSQRFDEQAAELIINSVIDALDNYTFYIQRTVTGEDVSPDTYPLLERELLRHWDDLQFVKAAPDASAVRQRRIENLQFAVPAAVGDQSNLSL